MMKREVGNKSFPIWLMGDSEPENWQDKLDTPLDPRHPARHNIWTPVLDAVQDQIFRTTGQRLDTSTLFIRNAIGDPAIKPRRRDIQWQIIVTDELLVWESLIAANHPCLIFTFVCV